MEGSFQEVSAAVRSAILGKGVNIAHVLPASQMLHRTGPAYGYSDDVYANAEIYEFCSASLSHKLARLDPDNIVMCPFAIGVYTLPAEPGSVRVTYKIPRGKPGTEKLEEEIAAFLASIIEDARW